MEILIVVLAVIAIVSSGTWAWITKNRYLDKVSSATELAKQEVESASQRAKLAALNAESEARQALQKMTQELEAGIRSKRSELSQIETKLMQKEQHLDTRESHLQEKEASLSEEMEKIRQLKKRHEDQTKELVETLERAAQLSTEDAKNILLTTVERDIRARAGQMVKEIEEQARKTANRKACEIVTDAIQRTALEYVQPASTSVVQLPDDELKGRIIGREGRNIRSFEAATGVDVIIDDTPGAVILSCFNPIRREIARLSMIKLTNDGRIHPGRIEEIVEKSRSELQEVIIDRGEKAAEQLRIQFHPKIIELIGKLHYRTSYGQNILSHSLETAIIAGMMADELGVNSALAKRGGMLHDIGKALDFETEGDHAHLGESICKKYGESDTVLNCIMAHHEDEEPQTIEAVLVTIADAISSTRPGARRESLETYVKRLEKLEAIAKSYDGVEKAYAIQAGREVRVLVKPDEVDDVGMKKVALDMAKKIESELDYPGQVKVTLIRETRATGIAK